MEDFHQLALLGIHVVLYGIPAIIIARYKSEKVYFFYAYFGVLFVLTQLFAILYSLQISSGLTITGGNIAYSSLILITMVMLFMTRDVAVVRNVIVMQIVLNVFLYSLYTLLAATLASPATFKSLSVDPKLFSTTIAVNISSTCVFIIEILLMFLLLEGVKKITTRPPVFLPLINATYIGILCLDGFLFPVLVMLFEPGFGQYIVGGVIGKLTLGITFSPFLLLFCIIFKGHVMRYAEARIRVQDMFLPTGSNLLKRLSETQSRLIESEQNYLAAYKEAKLYKDMFTHDIANVIQVISMNMRLYNQLGKETAERVMRDIQAQVEKANSLIQSVNKAARVEDRLLGLGLKDVEATISIVVDDIKNEFLDKVQIEVRPFNEVLRVRANNLLAEIFRNIISNAIRYNEAKTPRIDIKVSTEKGDVGMEKVRIEFTDNGIGIPDEQKPFIFQEGHKDKKGGKGMGLGLSLIVKALDFFGGDIHVEDRIRGEPSRGSNFIVRLPRYRD